MVESIRFPLKLAFALVSALVLGFYFNLAMPRWAVMTAGIVAGGSAFAAGGDPYAGALRLRGVLRIVGTFFGSAAALLLIIAFAQAPAILLLLACVWAGFCVWLSTLARLENASAMATASYTALTVIVTVYASHNLTLAPLYAIERCMEIVLGIICAIVADILFSPRSIKSVIDKEASSLLVAHYQLLKLALFNAGRQEIDKKLHEVVRRAAALKNMQTNLRLESKRWESASRRLSMLHALSLSLVTQATDIFLMQKISAIPVPAESRTLLHKEAQDIAALQACLKEIRGELGAHHSSARFEPLMRWTGTATQYLLLLKGLKSNVRINAIENNILSAEKISPVRSQESYPALMNGLRTFVATGTAALFWLYTGWTSGSSCMILLGVVTALAMRSPNPLAVAKDFVYGMAAAAPIAFLLYTVIIPATQQSLLLLCCVLGGVAFICGILLQRRQLGTMGAFAGILNAVTLENPMLFNMHLFIDNVLGQVIGSCLAMMVILLIPDKSKARTGNNIMNTLMYSVLTVMKPGFKHRFNNHLPALFHQLGLLQSLFPGDDDKFRMSLALIISHQRLRALELPRAPELWPEYQRIKRTADDIRHAGSNRERKQKLDELLAHLKGYQEKLVTLEMPKPAAQSVERLVLLLDNYHHAFNQA